jgi:hypothetical protein
MATGLRIRVPLPVLKLLVELAEEAGEAGDLEPAEAKAVADAHQLMDRAVAKAKATVIR